MAYEFMDYLSSEICVLRCALCRGHLSLSFSPVLKSLTDGGYFCGKCTPPIRSAPFFRVTLLDNFLKNMKFPCCFRQQGCPTVLACTERDTHELNCEYGFKPCPAFPMCSSEIVTLDLYPHFTYHHPEHVKQTAEFKLRIGHNSREVFIVKVRDVAFIVQYWYNGKDNRLRYDVRFDLGSGYEGSCALYVSDYFDLRCGVSLPSSLSTPFDVDFYDMENATTVALNKILPFIKEPKIVGISMNISPVERFDASTLL